MPAPRRPVSRAAIARLGAHALHAQYDARTLTAPARQAAATSLNARLAEQYGLDRAVLGPEEFERRLAHARSAYFRALALQRRAPSRGKRRRARPRYGPARADPA